MTDDALPSASTRLRRLAEKNRPPTPAEPLPPPIPGSVPLAEGLARYGLRLRPLDPCPPTEDHQTTNQEE